MSLPWLNILRSYLVNWNKMNSFSSLKLEILTCAPLRPVHSLHFFFLFTQFHWVPTCATRLQTFLPPRLCDSHTFFSSLSFQPPRGPQVRCIGRATVDFLSSPSRHHPPKSRRHDSTSATRVLSERHRDHKSASSE